MSRNESKELIVVATTTGTLPQAIVDRIEDATGAVVVTLKLGEAMQRLPAPRD